MKNVLNPLFFKETFLVPTSRLRNWDYSSPGYYFVTICTKDRIKSLGKIEAEIFKPTEAGVICKQEILNTEKQRLNTKLHKYTVMPNHLHMILEIKSGLVRRDVARYVSTKENKNHSTISPRPDSLGAIIRSIKSAITRQARLTNPQFQWQPRYYDHIIRSQQELLAVSRYIEDNIKNWDKDEYN